MTWILPGRRRRLALLSAATASALVLTTAPAASALPAEGGIDAGVSVNANGACTIPATPASSPKTFDNTTGKRTKELSWTGTVTDPGDAADVTQLKGTSRTSAKATVHRRSLDQVTVSGTSRARMTSAQGAASDCDTSLNVVSQVQAEVKIRKPGELTLRWQRSGRGIISPMGFGPAPGNPEDVFYIYYESGAPSRGSTTRKVKPGTYFFTVTFNQVVDTDDTQPGVTKVLEGDFQASLTFDPA